MTDENKPEPRLMTPVSFFGNKNDINPTITDFAPHPVSADDKAATEEALTPAPKEESAPASAELSTSTPVIEQLKSEGSVPPDMSPTELIEAAAKASGKVSEKSEDDSEIQNPTSPQPESSSPDSSSPPPVTTPGFPMPPAPVAPPTSD